MRRGAVRRRWQSEAIRLGASESENMRMGRNTVPYRTEMLVRGGGEGGSNKKEISVGFAALLAISLRTGLVK
jgi:hypothetical protein